MSAGRRRAMGTGVRKEVKARLHLFRKSG